MLTRLSIASVFVSIVLAASAGTANAECNCVAIAGDVAAGIQAEIAKADGLYARGDFNGALAIYAKVYASAKEPVLLYAQAMAKWQLGASADAKALFQQYIAAGGSLAYKDRAELALGKIGAGVTAGAAGALGATGGAVGAVSTGLRGGAETGLDAGAGAVTGTAGMGAGAVGAVGAEAKGKVKVGKTAGIVLGVIAIGALGVVGVHAIAAGLKDDIELDAKFDLGLGITGVAVGISAIYVAGLTAATGAAAGAACTPGLATLPAKKPIVAPYATQNGGGIAAAMTF
jgi:hypothetical protein